VNVIFNQEGTGHEINCGHDPQGRDASQLAVKIFWTGGGGCDQFVFKPEQGSASPASITMSSPGWTNSTFGYSPTFRSDLTIETSTASDTLVSSIATTPCC